MKRKNFETNVIAIVSIAILISGCNQIEAEHYQKSEVKAVEMNKALTFSKFSELHEICFSSDEKREKFEKENDFKSFFTISEEVYDKLDFEKCKTVEEIEQIVEENKDFIEIVYDENGERHVQPKLFYNPYKKAFNKDRIFFLGNDVYIAFDNVILCAPKEKYEQMKNEINFEKIPKEIEIFYLSPRKYNINEERKIENSPYEEKTEKDEDNENGNKIKRYSSCNYRQWCTAHPTMPNGNTYKSVGYIGTSFYGKNLNNLGAFYREWQEEYNKNLVGLYFEIVMEVKYYGPCHSGNWYTTYPYAQVYSKKKFLGLWIFEKHTLSLDCYVKVYTDYSGKVLGNTYPVLHDDDYYAYTIEYKGNSSLTGLFLPRPFNHTYYPSCFRTADAGTMNYRFWAKSAAVPKAIDKTFNANTFWYYCLAN